MLMRPKITKYAQFFRLCMGAGMRPAHGDRSPWGPEDDFTCSAEVNSACAKVLLRKTLVRA